MGPGENRSRQAHTRSSCVDGHLSGTGLADTVASVLTLGPRRGRRPVSDRLLGGRRRAGVHPGAFAGPDVQSVAGSLATLLGEERREPLLALAVQPVGREVVALEGDPVGEPIVDDLPHLGVDLRDAHLRTAGQCHAVPLGGLDGGG